MYPPKSAVGGMAGLHQWFLWRLTWNAQAQKFDKQPCSIDGARCPINAGDSANWCDFDTAAAAVARLDTPGNHTRYALGFWLTVESGYFLLDLDHAQGPDGKHWLPLAVKLCEGFPGAMIEKSSSGKGLHVIGRGTTAGHRTRPPRDIAERLAPLALEIYTRDRGIAFGLDGQAQGSADTPCSLQTIVDSYFTPANEAEGRATAQGGFTGTDDELIQRALSARVGVAAAFGGKASFAQLWRGECERNSENDMALASHLAFWTGRDAERVARLMWRSGMVREKWRDHRTYVAMTAGRACDNCVNVYTPGPQLVGPQLAAPAPQLAANDTSDLSNAYRLMRLHGERLLSVSGVGWHVWREGGPWIQDDHAAYQCAFDLGRVIQAEADAMTDWVNDETVAGSHEQKRRAGIQKNRRQWAKHSESRAGIENSLKMAEKVPGMYALANTLDASPHLLGMPSGVLDLTTCKMRPHVQADRITKVIACDFDPHALAPTWGRFVAEVMGGDTALIVYLQTLCGYMLSGERTEHLLPVFHGSGANGKSTLLATLQHLMAGYASSAPPGLLITRNANDNPIGVASLQGSRLVVVSETSESGRLNEEQVKALTGGDRIKARRLYQNYFEFDPTHLIVLQTNHKPRVTGTDEGIWRRVKLIPFNVTIPPERRDPALPAKLLAELPGILSWMVRGWQMYQRDGFNEPDAVKMATATYRSDSDHVGSFLEDRFEVRPGAQVQASQLYNAYKAWCAENGEHPLTQRTLGLRLAERPGIAQGRTKTARTWEGLQLSFSGVMPTLG